MGKKDGGFDYAYNAQTSVDADLQIIVGQHLSQNANDKQEVEPALKALHDTAGRLPDQLSADHGYWPGDNLQALEQSSADVYIATDKGEKDPQNTFWTPRTENGSRQTSITRQPITPLPVRADRSWQGYAKTKMVIGCIRAMLTYMRNDPIKAAAGNPKKVKHAPYHRRQRAFASTECIANGNSISQSGL